jgi:hypothetical protein
MQRPCQWGRETCESAGISLSLPFQLYRGGRGVSHKPGTTTIPLSYRKTLIKIGMLSVVLYQRNQSGRHGSQTPSEVTGHGGPSEWVPDPVTEGPVR